MPSGGAGTFGQWVQALPLSAIQERLVAPLLALLGPSTAGGAAFPAARGGERVGQGLPAGRASGGSVEARPMRLALLALALLAACVIVQSAGMLLLINWLARVRHVLESPSARRRVGLLLRYGRSAGW